MSIKTNLYDDINKIFDEKINKIVDAKINAFKDIPKNDTNLDKDLFNKLNLDLEMTNNNLKT